MRRSAFVRSAIGMLIAAVAIAPPCLADTYPSKPVTIVNPFAAGGITDVAARYYANKLSTRLGQPFIVDIKVGGGGTIATNHVIRSPGDGYTLLFGSRVTQITSPLINKVPVPTEKDLTALATVSDAAPIIVALPNSPFKTIRELVAYARANPGKLNYGSPGSGSAAHLAAIVFMNVTGISMTHVPYKGSAPALQDLIGGNLDIALDYPGSSMSFIKAGRIRPLVTLYQHRYASLPDVPTSAESGIQGAESASWLGFFAPASTPQNISALLTREIAAINALPETQQKISEWGMAPLSIEGAAFTRFIRSENARWRAVIERSGIRAE